MCNFLKDKISFFFSYNVSDFGTRLLSADLCSILLTYCKYMIEFSFNVYWKPMKPSGTDVSCIVILFNFKIGKYLHYLFLVWVVVDGFSFISDIVI